MKKLILPLAALAILFGACKKDNDNEKILSKIMHSWVDEDGNPRNSTQTFEYDNQNRMTKMIWASSSGWRDELVFFYSGNSNAPTKYTYTEYSSTGEVDYESESLMEYAGNQVFRIIEREEGGRDTASSFTIDANGRVTKETWGWGSTVGEETFSYNADGNMTKVIYVETYQTYEGEEVTYRSETNLSYSGVRSVFRHANITDWFLWFSLGYEYSKSGYMVSRIQREGNTSYYNFTYTTDANGYALTRTETYVRGSSPAPARNFRNVSAVRSESPARQAAPGRKNGEEEDEEYTVTYEYTNAK